MPSFDVEILSYFVAGAAIIAGVYAYKNCDRFLRDWFSLFSGIMGWLAIGLVTAWLLTERPNVMLALFWIVILCLAGLGIWANRRHRKKSNRQH